MRVNERTDTFSYSHVYASSYQYASVLSKSSSVPGSLSGPQLLMAKGFSEPVAINDDI